MSVAVEWQWVGGSAGLPGGESGSASWSVLTLFWDEKGYSYNPDKAPLLHAAERISFA